jgi:peroxiredoxin
MIRTFGLLSIAVAALTSIGCQEAISKTPETTATKRDDSVQQAAATSEAKEETAVKIGDKAPAWKDLAGTDDKKHGLADLKKSKAVVVVFTSNTCPVAQAYEERLNKLSTDYKDKGVSVIAINVNKDDRNNLEAMKERAEKQGFTFTYLTDPSQQVGRDFGATCTPHVFLLDGERQIAYAGAIDDDMKADAVKQHSLQDAIDAVLAGKAPAVAQTKQFGCGIHYE